MVNNKLNTDNQEGNNSKLSLTLDELNHQSSDRIYTCLTGMRPSGRVHIGHYVGALKNWLEIQKNKNIQSYFMIADKQVLGDYLDKTDIRRQAVNDMIIDWISLGLDYEKNPFVIQSQIPALSELTDYLMMMTPDKWIRINPTVKAEMKKIIGVDESNDDELNTGENNVGITSGFVNYPISQTADIIGFSGDIVPVGEDQLPHIELTRKVVRRVNHTIGSKFNIPQALLSDVPRLIGTDGNEKMGKSLGNAISMTASLNDIKRMVNSMYTDPTKKIISSQGEQLIFSPGNIEHHVVFKYLDIFYGDKEHLADLRRKYIEGGDNSVGDGELKKLLVKVLDEIISPVRLKREDVLKDTGLVKRVIQHGTESSMDIVEKNVTMMKELLGLTY